MLKLNHHRVTGVLSLACVSMLVHTGSALAGHKSSVEVDIESLKGRLYAAPDLWDLRISYDVEIEGKRPRGTFDLVVELWERGRPLMGTDGRPFQIIIPLDRPTEVDDDELEFEQTVMIQLPLGAIADPHHLRLRGMVVRQPDGRVMDEKSRSVSFRSDRGHRSVHVGVEIGGW